MKLGHALILSASLLALPLTYAPDAAACGACFGPVDTPTQVTGHRMLLSISKQETTLWDQIEYTGDPASFAWVLPIKGQVEVGLSSDALFATLDDITRVTVTGPICPPPPFCEGAGGGFGNAGAGGGGGGGVIVISQEVVGPYETVQLSSQDPAALKNWLQTNNYNVPQDIFPIIDAYVKEGFDFLALKLVPGQGVNAMRPVRVTSPGASPNLPLRMVAGGTGAITPITLWVTAEGRYDPSNFAFFEIKESDLVWDWDKQSSNYNDLKQAGFAGAKNANWLMQSAQPRSTWEISSPLQLSIEFDTAASGYGDGDFMKAQEELDADLAKVYGSLAPNSLWVTRINAELSRLALTKDLALAASASQAPVQNSYQVDKTTGTSPCQTFPPCPGSGSSGGNGGAGANGSNGSSSEVGGCAIGGEGNGAATLIAAALGLALSRLRRRQAR